MGEGPQRAGGHFACKMPPLAKEACLFIFSPYEKMNEDQQQQPKAMLFLGEDRGTWFGGP